MATQSPFSLLDQWMTQWGVKPPQPPQWLVRESQRRLVLLLNHVLQQEPEAMEHLARQRGRQVALQWRELRLSVTATPVGLLDLAPDDGRADLTLTVAENSPLGLLQAGLRGDRPPVRIEGDVQLAGDVNWLVDHVRWDVEQDLSRIIGDAAAHTLAGTARQAALALRQFLAQRGDGPRDKGPA